MSEKNCKNCNKVFNVIPSRYERTEYCSKDCQLAFRRAPEVICLTCKNLFKNYRTDRTNAPKFCSITCLKASTPKDIIKTCPFCNATFSVVHWQAKRQNFCSKSCGINANSERITKQIQKTCLGCKGRFSPKGRTKKLQTSAKFCNLRCRAKYTEANFAKRFWSKVDKTGDCWLWLGQLNINGYGTICMPNHKNKMAHRIAYELNFAILDSTPSKLYVCHKCDNPKCVNPQHLFLGTHQNNMDDMKAKARTAHGEKCHNSKLTDEKVREARKLKKEGCSMVFLARKNNVSFQAMSAAILGRTWGHVKN